MQIQKINNTSPNPYTPKFSGIYRDCYIEGNLKHRNVSWMFRPSLIECKNFYSYISDVFKDISKVNVYNYACSLGYEAYSFIMGMFSGLEENPEKFMPIIAKDYDETIINCAKSHILPFEKFEIKLLENLLGDKNRVKDFWYLFEKNPEYNSYLEKLVGNGGMLGLPGKNLTDNINFSVADIRTDYKNINPENSLVLATNFWPYMSDDDRFNLAKNLYSRLKNNCYVKIDSFDNGILCGGTFVSTANLLQQSGFKLTPVLNLFKK